MSIEYNSGSMSTMTSSSHSTTHESMATSMSTTKISSQPIQFTAKSNTSTVNAYHYNNFILSPTFKENSHLDNSIVDTATAAAKKSKPSNQQQQQPKANGFCLNGINELSNNRVSAFVPFEEIITNDQAGAKNEIVSRIFDEVCVQDGDVDNLIRVMSFHPDFLNEFMNLYNYLMYSQHGALPYDSRHFIAIMAATRHKCIYLVKQQEREFLLQNGQKAWIHGINYIPQKLKDLYELNKLLCHQPWLINQTHIEKILKGQFSWTVTELTMAITILTLFHSLSGFAFGCGINENYVQQLQRQHEAEQEEKLKQTQRALNAAQMAAAARLKKMEKSENSRDQDNDELSDEEEELDENDDEAEDYNQEDDQYYDDDDNERAKGPRGSSSRRRARRRRHNQNAYASGNEIGVNDDEGGDSDANGELINEELTTTAETTGSGELGGQFYAANRTSRSNYRNSDSQCDIIASQMSYRARSNSTGTSNRTLSNSSASSCELGIDMLLKEMQMIRAEDKTTSNHLMKSSSLSSTAKFIHSSSSPIAANKMTSATSGSALPTILSPTTTTANNYNSNTNHNHHQNHNHHTSSALLINNLSSGTNTITNSPIGGTIVPTTTTTAGSAGSGGNGCCNYLSDLSNTELNNSNNYHATYYHYHNGAAPNSNGSVNGGGATRHFHDNNNNTINGGEKNNIENTNANGVTSKIEENDACNDDMDSEIEIDNELNEETCCMQTSQLKSSVENINDKNNTNTTTKLANLNEQQHEEKQPVNSSYSSKTSIINRKIKDYMLKYAYDPEYSFLDFKNADQSLKLEYYTWENQGYITAYSIYPDICELLDKNFKIAFNMTYNTMGSVKAVDTSLFRRAVWYYTHSLFGVKYDDYDYNQIRILLKSPLRRYIKIICSSPQKITKLHYDSIMREFTHSEKVHVNIVIMQARIQASMLYFLRAINSYFG